jgi:predicted transcriptional regulator
MSLLLARLLRKFRLDCNVSSLERDTVWPCSYDAVGANLQEMPSTAETPASTARTVAI